MTLYIHGLGLHHGPIDPETPELPDLKNKLKALSGTSPRRTDRFIQLAIIGAHQAAAVSRPNPQTALYMTSGQGNIMVFDRVVRQRHFTGNLTKPADFINLAGNTAAYYVAAHLGLEGRNLFLAHHHFPVQMTMLLAQNDLQRQTEEAILIGAVDEVILPLELGRKFLGVEKGLPLAEGSNWMLVKSNADGALAGLEIKPECFSEKALKNFLSTLTPGTRLAFSRRFSAAESRSLQKSAPGCERYHYEAASAYHETLPLYVLNLFLNRENGVLVHLDKSPDSCRYLIMCVDNQQSS